MSVAGGTADAIQLPDGTYQVIGNFVQNPNSPGSDKVSIGPNDLNNTIIGPDKSSVVKNVYKGVVGQDQSSGRGVVNTLENAGAQAGTFGLVGVAPDGSATPGVTGAPILSEADKAAAAIKSALGPVLAPAVADPSGLADVRDRAFRTQDALTGRIQNLEANPTQAPQSDLVQLDQTNIDPLRARQTTALDQLQAAANGTVPSAAEILGRDQANRAAALAYGNAAALQGGASSGGALRQALDAQTQIQGDANTQLLAARAKEMSDARNQLVSGIGAAQNTEAGLATTNANLNQNKNIANTQAAVTTHGQDVTQQGDLVSGQNTALATGAGAEKAAVDAATANAASANALKGAEIGGAAAAIPGIVKAVSDRRAKTDIRSADLVQLADAAPGYTFEYKDERDGPGQRVGVMAQDLKRSRLGQQLVQLGDDGKLELDGANSIGAALAMSAAALRKAEAARKGRK